MTIYTMIMRRRMEKTTMRKRRSRGEEGGEEELARMSKRGIKKPIPPYKILPALIFLTNGHHAQSPTHKYRLVRRGK